MSLSHASLPDFVLADLFKDVLVVMDKEVQRKSIPAETPPAPATSAIAENPPAPAPLVEKIAKIENNGPLNFLGNNQRNISIIVEDAQAIHLSDEQLDILANILTACKLNLADVAIINNHGQQVNLNQLQPLLPKLVLLFGVTTGSIGLPFSVPDYQAQQYNGCTYLVAQPLTTMLGQSNEAKLEKSKLWKCLKALFGI